MSYPVPRLSKHEVRVKRGLAGLGLVAVTAIPKGEYVIEYTGELIKDEEADRRGGKYLFQLGNGKTVDGKGRANIARYINHECKPNCETDVIGNRIFITTVKPIAAGEELSYDYGEEYFNEYIKPFGCRCASCAKKRAKLAGKV